MLTWHIILLQILTFIGLILVLHTFFSRNLSSALKRLKNLQEEGLNKEAQFKEEQERVKQEQLAEIDKARQQAKKMIEDAKKEADALRAANEEAAKQERDRIIAAAGEELERLKEDIRSGFETQSLDSAVEIIKYIFTDKNKEALQRHFTDEIIDEIASLGKERFSAKSDKALVLSGFSLTEEEKARLKNTLSEKIGSEIAIEEQLDPGLIAGIVVRMDEFIIDGSLKNKLAKVMPYLKKF